MYDNLRTARDIVEGEVREESKKALLRQIDTTEGYLKFSFLEHIGMDDDILHCPEKALGDTSPEPVALHATQVLPCMAPLQVVPNIQSALREPRPDIFDTLKEIRNKMSFYMGPNTGATTRRSAVLKYLTWYVEIVNPLQQ